jgi:adenylate kinase family enzyme
VLDGHDGSGKTTLAARLAQYLGGVHVRPFSGNVGELFLWSIERGDFSFAGELARHAVEHALAKHDAPVLIFDRHWMTVFSVLPEAYWNAWEPLPPTTLCWASLETTLSRLAVRSDDEDRAYDHQHFLSVYRQLGQRFGSHVLDTSDLTPDESFEILLSWARRFIK